MYCKEHMDMVRCNSIKQTECEVCGKGFMVSNAPPEDLVCRGCSEELSVCQYCGHDIEIQNKLYQRTKEKEERVSNAQNNR